MILSRIAEKAHWKTVQKSNGVEALAWLKNNQNVDAVLTDLQMPQLDGWGLASAIRALDSTLASVPIVAISGNDSEANRKRCQDVGIDAFMPKPVKPKAIHDFLKHALKVTAKN